MSRSERARNIVLLFTSTLTVMAGATIAPSLPGMEQAFHQYPNVELLVKMLVTMPAIVIVIAAPIIGWVIDAFNRKWMLVSAVLLYGVAGGSGYIFSDNLIVLFVGRLLLGLAVAGVMVSCGALIADYFPGPARAKYMGLLAAFGGFGGVVFMGVGTVLASLHWTLPFVIYFSALVLLPLLILYVDEPQKDAIVTGSSHTGPSSGAPESGAEEEGAGHKKLKPLLILCCVFSCVEVFSIYMMPLHFPFFYSDVNISLWALDEFNVAGLVITWLLLVMSLVSFYFGRLKRDFSFITLQTLGFILIAIGFGLLGGKPSVVFTFVAAALAGAGLGLIRPNVVVWVLSVVPANQRGRVMGAITSCAFVGQFISPILTQPLVDRWGYGSPFYAMAVALLLAVVLLCAWRLLQNRVVSIKKSSDADIAGAPL